jgi:tryptophan synthase alpha chain
MKHKLMTHVIAGYPSEAECIELMLGMQNAGVFAIEVQIPFSDPSADGSTIMKANDIALLNGTTTVKCFEMIGTARTKGLNCPIFVMSYANKLFSYGFENFCGLAKKHEVEGLIIPDLPYDSPEYRRLHNICSELNLGLVLVISPGMSDERLASFRLKSCKLVYMTSMHGITGKEFSVREDLINFAITIRAKSDCHIALGFGIRNKDHVKAALDIADIAVIGSETIRIIEKKGTSEAIKFVGQLTGKDTSQL